jgi:oligoendopeptidase F
MRYFITSEVSKVAARLLIYFPVTAFCVSNPIIQEDVMLPSRSQVASKNKWNVEALYSDPSDWLKDFSYIKGRDNSPRWPELASYKGRLNDPKAMVEFLDIYLTLNRKLEKLSVYAHLRFDEDQDNDQFKTNDGLIKGTYQDFAFETSWFEPEVLELSPHILKDPALASYQFYFDQLLRARPHTLSPDKEALLALSGKAMSTSSRAFSALSNSDMSFKPAIDSEGNEHLLSNGSYGSLIQSPDRNLRKTAVLNLHKGYAEHLNTLCELLQGQTQAHYFNAKSRNFSDSVTAALFSKNVDPAVVRQLIATVKGNSHLMAEYIALRKSTLKLDEIHAYDMSCPLVPDLNMKMSYDEACATVIASVEPLGSDYQAALKKGLMEDRWVDVFENQKKRSGAYSSGCYDSMPYILLNFHDTLNDATTLAHEAGHSMHSYLSRKNQPYIYSQYTIFVAEVASTFNEQLLLDELMKKVKTKEEKAYLISDQIDRIRGTVFRQTMFAEFELKIHEMVEQGQPLTPALLNKTYAGLIREYYGPNFVIDKELEVEWARIPHFYYNFYVYQYATGISAAMALHEQALKSPEARDRYLKFLGSGGSKYPLDLLKDAGVDMTTSAPIEAAMHRFAYLVKELKKNLE